MKPNNTGNLPIKRKTRISDRPPVAVCLKHQLLLPICVEVVEEFKTSGLIPAGRICIQSAVNPKNKLWLDAPLLKEALIDLLEDAVKCCDIRERIVLSVSSTGMHCCRCIISYLHQKDKNESHEDRFEMRYYSRDRTREIVAQHQAGMNLMRDGRNVMIELSFP